MVTIVLLRSTARLFLQYLGRGQKERLEVMSHTSRFALTQGWVCLVIVISPLTAKVQS